MDRQVIKLPPPFPKIPSMGISRRGAMRVAAYARVSTNHEEQHTSLEAQTDYYRKKISENPAWNFAGIYADDGLSGTSVQRREEFNRMIQDCRDGKIDMILTKSISRFARNAVDTISIIRELKSLDIGVRFEKENLWTLDEGIEFILALLSSFAQEESRSLSENILWGKQKMMDGNYSVHSKTLGFRIEADHSLAVDEKQAVIVRRIFDLTLQGYSSDKIAQKLCDENHPTALGGSTWNPSTVLGIVQNEKYRGDALLQKTFTKDFLTKKRKKNRGEKAQYYVHEGHECYPYVNTFEPPQKARKLGIFLRFRLCTPLVRTPGLTAKNG